MISSQRSDPSAQSLHAHEQSLAGLTFAGVAIRILIADDIEAWHPVYTAVLRQNPNWELVGEARDISEVIPKIRELKPHVVLLGLGPGDVHTLDAARQITYASADSRILLLGNDEPAQLPEIAQSVGAFGYILKRNVVVDLVPALRALAQGRRFFSLPIL